jgi:2-polyprenyl-3-methyl-5-hydroxy-6-metoxy-1,4-benzoquinol methylase
MTEAYIRNYTWQSTDASHTDAYLFAPVLARLSSIAWRPGPRRVFDLGCGNGATAAALASFGYEVIGVDPSEQGVRLANAAHRELQIQVGSCYEDLAGRFGPFPAVISLEVVEHVFYPRQFAACIYDLLEPGGTAIISTPYHGYWKNLALALTGKLDSHFTALWECGHIKFWSIKTLTILLEEAGLKVREVIRVGRLPVLAKSMIAVAQRPAN